MFFTKWKFARDIFSSNQIPVSFCAHLPSMVWFEVPVLTFLDRWDDPVCILRLFLLIPLNIFQALNFSLLHHFSNIRQASGKVSSDPVVLMGSFFSVYHFLWGIMAANFIFIHSGTHMICRDDFTWSLLPKRFHISILPSQYSFGERRGSVICPV